MRHPLVGPIATVPFGHSLSDKDAPSSQSVHGSICLMEQTTPIMVYKGEGNTEK